MSNSAQPTGTGGTDRLGIPRALVHKKIMDAAESRPDDSMAEIANSVSGASVALVERVLEEYGDPAVDSEPDDDSSGAVAVDASEPELETESTPDETPAASDADYDVEANTDPTDEEPIDGDEANDSADERAVALTPSELTSKQLETLRAIEDDVDATQGELATELGVSRAAICQRVNSIDGFDWSNRGEFIAELFEDSAQAARATDDRATEVSERLLEFDRRLQRIENRLDGAGRNATAGTDAESATPCVNAEPKLAHKILHACLRSERITEAEELQIIRDVMCSNEVTDDRP